MLLFQVGGEDSCFVAHRLKYEHGMNPLSDMEPLKYTDIGVNNFDVSVTLVLQQFGVRGWTNSSCVGRLCFRVWRCFSCVCSWPNIFSHSYGIEIWYQPYVLRRKWGGRYMLRPDFCRPASSSLLNDEAWLKG